MYIFMNICTGSFWDIETFFLTQPASFWAHTDETRTQPVSVVSINHSKTASQPASDFTPRRNSNFVVKDFLNREENHRENRSDFSYRKSEISYRKLRFQRGK